MTEHVIYIVNQQERFDPDSGVVGPAVAVCWRPTEDEAIAVADRLRAANGPAYLLWVAPLSDVAPGLVAVVDTCQRDKGCQREDGHDGSHMSRWWNAYTSTEEVEEWADGEERP